MTRFSTFQIIFASAVVIFYTKGCATKAAPSVPGHPGKNIKNAQCGTYLPRGGKIVGGTTAAPGEFPWMVSFKGKHGHFCGGSLISDTVVISAAHCFHKNEYLDYNKDGSVNLFSLNATIGEYSLKDSSESSEVSVSLKKIHLHSMYDPVNKQNDIAIVEIVKNPSVQSTIEPVCLPHGIDSASWSKDTKVTVVGWGLQSSNQNYYDWQKKMDAVQKVNVKIWDKEACLEKYKGLVSLQKFPSKSFLCAGEQGKESCEGDSGGPMLQLIDKKKWILAGVVANGIKCGDTGKPGVYTLVSDFLPWITSVVR